MSQLQQLCAGCASADSAGGVRGGKTPRNNKRTAPSTLATFYSISIDNHLKIMVLRGSGFSCSRSEVCSHLRSYPPTYDHIPKQVEANNRAGFARVIDNFPVRADFI